MRIVKTNTIVIWVCITILIILAQYLINQHLIHEKARLEQIITVYENGTKDYYCK